MPSAMLMISGDPIPAARDVNLLAILFEVIARISRMALEYTLVTLPFCPMRDCTLLLRSTCLSLDLSSPVFVRTLQISFVIASLSFKPETCPPSLFARHLRTHRCSLTAHSTASSISCRQEPEGCSGAAEGDRKPGSTYKSLSS